MKDKTTKTQQNLMTAFLRESGAFMEYTFYSKQAKIDGFQDIANVFNLFANNEQAHAKVWFDLFHGLKNTCQNLKDAKDLENYESSVMYSEFSEIAKKEGFLDIATLFDKVAQVERQHEQTYQTLYEKVKDQSFFLRRSETEWQCLNCGHIHKGKTPPKTCPVCSHPEGYFKELKSN